MTADEIPFSEATTFRAEQGRFVFTVLDGTVDFVADRLRRERHELHGELAVRCDLKGVRTYQGVLNVGSLNFSSTRARHERARQLADRAKTREIDWLGYLEEFAQRILVADRAGEPALVLRDVDLPADADEHHEVLGVRFPRRHPSFLFGDGGTLKSLFALYCAGVLQQRGEHVCFFDAELDEFTHRKRFGELFGDMPAIRYVRCDRPLVYDVDRLKQIVQQERITYGIFDSVAFLCNGAPESAEAAGEYFRSQRQLGIGGTLNIAHVTKGENNDQKPFGSVFWANGARSTWFVKASTPAPSGLAVGLFNRKANLGPLRPAVGIDYVFAPGRTTLTRVNPADVDDLAASLPLWARMKAALTAGPMTIAALATELDASTDTIATTARRKTQLFTKLTATADGVHRLALVERRAS